MAKSALAATPAAASVSTPVPAASAPAPQKGKDCAQHFWDKVIGQDKVVRALKYSLDSETLTHAFLFVGPQGLGKINAARAVATQLMCPAGGCGSCHICTRLENNTHPDFQVLEPAGSGKYLVEQVRELNYQVQLAPAEAERKIFVITDVDLFGANAANAFLKTLEEPTESTIFILLSTTKEAVLPTISSRCQVYRFRPMAPEAARKALHEKVGISGQAADIALAANAYIVGAARDYLQSPKQQESRLVTVRVFRDLAYADDLDVLRMARELLRSALDSVSEMRALMDAEFIERKELLDPVALKQLERYNERRLSAFEKRQTAMVLSVFLTLLADCLRISSTQTPSAEGIINVDAHEDLYQLMQVSPLTPARATLGQEHVARARRRLTRNVNVALLTEALLFDLREVLTCQ